MTGRIETYLEAVRTALEAPAIFKSIRVHLDPYDLEAALKESFRTPAARVIFGLGQPEPEAEGGLSLRLVFAVVVIASREGRQNPDFASADAASLDLAQQVAQLVADDPYFGQGKVKAAETRGLKVAVSEKTSQQGLAITVMEFEAVLLRWVNVRDPISEMFAAMRPSPFPDLTLNGVVDAQDGSAA